MIKYLFLLVIIFILPFYLFINKVSSYFTTNKPELYQSKNLKFSVTLPPGFKAQEVDTGVLFNKAGTLILLDRVATNFENVSDYMNNLTQKNNLQIQEKKDITIDQWKGIKGKIQKPTNSIKEELVYFIYVDGWIYTFSTTAQELYKDLDSIIYSFKFVPN